MALEKLQIYVEDKPPVNEKLSFGSDPIKVLFNPNRITITNNGWRTSEDQETRQLVYSQEPPTLNVEFFFDTSALDTSSGLTATSATDVRKYTRRIYSLTVINGKLARPPLCRLVWGGEVNLGLMKGSLLFQGLLKQVTKTFTHFTPSGMPVRATLNCTFVEWEDDEVDAKNQNIIDDPIRVVRRGETLSSIAAEEYGDPGQWRIIAAANRLDNPRRLSPGQVLTVPPLRV